MLDRRGGEARQLTSVKGNLSGYAWSPDAKKLLLVIAEDPEEQAREKEKSESEKEKPKPIVIDRYHFKQDIEGYLSANTRPDLIYLYDVAAWQARQADHRHKIHESRTRHGHPTERKSHTSAIMTPILIARIIVTSLS